MQSDAKLHGNGLAQNLKHPHAPRPELVVLELGGYQSEGSNSLQRTQTRPWKSTSLALGVPNFSS